jgi:hypothetical protein
LASLTFIIHLPPRPAPPHPSHLHSINKGMELVWMYIGMLLAESRLSVCLSATCLNETKQNSWIFFVVNCFLPRCKLCVCTWLLLSRWLCVCSSHRSILTTHKGPLWSHLSTFLPNLTSVQK